MRRTARTAADGVGATEWLEMGGEKKPLEISELGCADGCGREMGAENCADGCGRRGCKGVAGNGWGEEAAGDQRAWLRGRLRTGNGCGELRGRLRTAWVEWPEMGGEKKPLGMSELGCADGCGREMGAENCADGCGRRGCRWKWVMSQLGCADGCGREMGAENCADGCGRRARELLEMGGRRSAGDQRAWLRGQLRTGNAENYGCGRRGCKGVAGKWCGAEAAGDARSELGCADGCGRQMVAENCADGCGRRGWKE